MDKKIISEYQECRAYWEWAQYHPLLREYLIKHVNEGKRSVVLGKLLKLIGLRPGIPDYQLPIPNREYIGFWLEMKRKDEINKKQRPEQIYWINNLRKLGHYANFAYGYEDAIQQTMCYMNCLS